ncbi:MAG: hypothetical protein JWN39_1079 [Ilumatobacteraceae bacterium]|nr:hypothetical protein [Ilumatobacteraceae bacterium]
MSQRRGFAARMVLAVARLGAVAISAACVTLAGGSTTHAAAADATTSYAAVQPCRLVDTRTGIGASTVDALTFDVPTRGLCDVPAGATALAVTLTAVRPAGRGFLTAWPSDQPRPTASNINFDAGQVRANGSIVMLDPTGTFRVFTSVPASVVVDVVGAFVPAATARAGRFVPASPTRLLDTRATGRVPGGSSVEVALPAGVPADAIALALNVTVTDSTASGFVTAYPTGQAVPQASILDLDGAGQTRAAGSILPVSAGGVALYLSGGGNVVVDLLGYFTGPSAASGSDGLFTAIAPTRVLDTRDVSPLGTAVPIHPGGGLELSTGHGGSVAFNITSVDGDPGFIAAYPAGTTQPPTSTINAIGGGDVVANFAMIQMSGRGLDLFSKAESHVLIDVQGWFTGPSASAVLPPPANVAPAGPVVTYSACSNGGNAPLDQFNAARAVAHAVPLVLSSGGQQFACAYALQLARQSNGLAHSNEVARDAAFGCTSGENIAYATGTSVQTILDLWFKSAPHLANIKSSMWRSVAVGFVTRTEPTGETMTWAAADFGAC